MQILEITWWCLPESKPVLCDVRTEYLGLYVIRWFLCSPCSMKSPDFLVLVYVFTSSYVFLCLCIHIKLCVPVFMYSHQAMCSCVYVLTSSYVFLCLCTHIKLCVPVFMYWNQAMCSCVYVLTSSYVFLCLCTHIKLCCKETLLCYSACAGQC
jgi:hypothetical protein